MRQLTTRRQEVMDILQKHHAYLYACRHGYAFGGWVGPDVPSRTFNALYRKGLLQLVRHPQPDGPHWTPAMPYRVWVAKEASG